MLTFFSIWPNVCQLFFDDLAEDDYDHDDGDGEKAKAVLLQHEKVQLGKEERKGWSCCEAKTIPKNCTATLIMVSFIMVFNMFIPY